LDQTASVNPPPLVSRKGEHKTPHRLLETPTLPLPENLTERLDSVAPVLDPEVGRQALARAQETPFLKIKKMLTGQVKEIRDILFNQSTISSVKRQAKEAFGINEDTDIKLIHKGKPLNNYDTLEELGIKSGDELILSIPMRTGRGGGKTKTCKKKKCPKRNRRKTSKK